MKDFVISIAICSKGRSDELYELAIRLKQMLQTLKVKQAELVIIEDVSEQQSTKQGQLIHLVDVYEMIDEKGIGFGGIRQRAVDLSQGEIIVFIDDDCLPSEDWLDELLRPFSNQKVVAVGGGILPQKGGVIASATALIGLPAGGIPRLLESDGQAQASDLLSTGNLALSKAAIVKAGGFDTRHRFGGEDQQLVKKLEGKKYFVPKALVYHRNRDNILDVWSWFTRRGMGEYRLNRIKGMGKLKSLIHPWHWSWSWRIILLLFVGLFGGAIAIFMILLLYYLLLLVRIMRRNMRVSSIPQVEKSRVYCFRLLVLLFAPVVRVCMDIAREHGRLSAWMVNH